MRSLLRVLGAGALCPVLAVAQDAVFEQLPLRISSLRPNGGYVVDRGRRDQVQVGDRVVLAPRNGQVVQGSVTEVEDRTALVELVDRSVVLPIGTKGHLLLPRARLQPAKPVAAPPVQPAEPAPAAPTKPEDEWRPGMPLLGNTRPPRPDERPTTVTGRVYTAADLVRTLDSFSQSFLRTGTDLEVQNVDGNGGTLRLHGEFDWSEEVSGFTGTDIRLFDFSYAGGGTRWQPLRWQVGRFLPQDMPEFGLLDGAEVGYRSEGGDRFGGSVGYLPELDDDMESFADLQVAAWYLWNADIGERLTYGLGYQKSWHRFEADRDLFVAKARLLPLDGWDLASTVWLDVYTGSDNGKGSGVGLTRLNAFASRRWGGAGGLEFAYDHEEYPETLRRELPQTIQPLTILDAHQDRLSAHAYWQAGQSSQWHTRLTGWADEEREGGAAELGVTITGLLQAGAATGLTVFDVQGLTSTVVGLRIDHGGNFSFGRLDLLYELGLVHHEGFPDDRDDLLQHRLGALLTSDLGSQWHCTFYADGTLWDDELSFGVGVYLERHF